MSEYDDDFELDELDEFDDADDDELFEKESQEEDFEERMARESEAYLKGVDDGIASAQLDDDVFGDYNLSDDLDDLDDEEREQYEAGYRDGFDSEDDLDEE